MVAGFQGAVDQAVDTTHATTEHCLPIGLLLSPRSRDFSAPLSAAPAPASSSSSSSSSSRCGLAHCSLAQRASSARGKGLRGGYCGDYAGTLRSAGRPALMAYVSSIQRAADESPCRVPPPGALRANRQSAATAVIIGSCSWVSTQRRIKKKLELRNHHI